MPTRTATAQWNGPVADGDGTVALGSSSFRGAYSWRSRFEQGTGTNPEELIAAAHAGCFSMALAAPLQQAGHVPESIDTHAEVKLAKRDSGFEITSINLATRARVGGIDDSEFQRVAADAERNCPVSKALAAVNSIQLDPRLAD
jgi:osmotically inducible protein OsmC